MGTGGCWGQRISFLRRNSLSEATSTSAPGHSPLPKHVLEARSGPSVFQTEHRKLDLDPNKLNMYEIPKQQQQKVAPISWPVHCQKRWFSV